MGLTQAAVHHGENDQSRKAVDAKEQISDCYYQSVDSQESDHLNQVNENIEDKACDTVGDLAACDDVEKNDAFISVEQEFHGGIGESDYNLSSDEQINAKNQVKDVQAESNFADSSEIKDTSTLSAQELPGQHAHDNEGVNSVGNANDANGDPSKDSDHTIDAENMTVDDPDCTIDSVEVDTVGEANDNNGNLSQESDVTVDVENSNIDEPDIIHDSSKTIDANAEQTESMADDDVDHNDISQKELPVQCAHDSKGVNTADKATDVNDDPSKDSDHTIDAENMTVDDLIVFLIVWKSIQLVRQMR
jgi:hypothetical protein